MKFLKFFIESISLMSIKSFYISLVGLLTIVIIANFIGKIVAQSKKKEEIMRNVNTFNIRLIRFLTQLFGIIFGLIMYWEYKDINESNGFISSDIFLPIILLILGRFFWFDTNCNDFIEAVKDFKPSKDCLLATMIPIATMILAVTLVHNNIANFTMIIVGLALQKKEYKRLKTIKIEL
ncbi:hypothetical protein [Tissierella praeacuta]|uniref:hypothetical protein n=1 Tax=Tissierella praeacuta TaxID=43131 RepID=UPI00289A6C0A|nr:hypothetical protein [Tissierella praeacuta]